MVSRLSLSDALFWVLVLSFISPFVSYMYPIVGVGFAHFALLALVGGLVLRGRKVRIPVYIFAPSLFVFVSIISALANYLEGSFEVDVNDILKWVFIQLLCLCYYYIIKYTSCEIENLFRAVMAGLFISIVLAWISWAKAPTFLLSVPMLHQLAEGDFLINRNYVGYFISLGVCLAFAFFIKSFSEKKLKRQKLVYGVVFLFFGVSALFSFSKGTWLVSVLGVSVLLFLYGNQAVRRFLFLLCGVFFVFAFVYSDINWFSDLYLKIVERITSSGSSNADRINYVKDSLFIINENVWFGVGPGGYSSATSYYSLHKTADPHNAILWVFGEIGLVGAIMAMLFMAITLIILLANKKHPLVIYLVALWVPTLINAVLHGLPVVSQYSWLVYACLIGLSQKTPAKI